jgi:hypothetical protein
VRRRGGRPWRGGRKAAIFQPPTAAWNGEHRDQTEAGMNEDVFNMEVRKFLKKVGVTSQREIEQAVRAAIESGKLRGTETLKARITLTVEGLDLSHDIDGDIALT